MLEGNGMSGQSLPSSVSVLGGTLTQESDLTLPMEGEDSTVRDPIVKRRSVLIETYNENVGEKSNDKVFESLRKTIIKKGVLNRIKFLKEGRRFGSYDHPDFTAVCWQSVVFDGMANMRHLTDRQKAIKWITYRSMLRKLFVGYKTDTTYKMKRSLMECKYNMIDSLLNENDLKDDD